MGRSGCSTPPSSSGNPPKEPRAHHLPPRRKASRFYGRSRSRQTVSRSSSHGLVHIQKSRPTPGRRSSRHQPRSALLAHGKLDTGYQLGYRGRHPAPHLRAPERAPRQPRVRRPPQARHASDARTQVGPPGPDAERPLREPFAAASSPRQVWSRHCCSRCPLGRSGNQIARVRARRHGRNSWKEVRAQRGRGPVTRPCSSGVMLSATGG